MSAPGEGGTPLAGAAGSVLSSTRKCRCCGTALPIVKREHAKFCSPRCRVAFHRWGSAAKFRPKLTRYLRADHCYTSPGTPRRSETDTQVSESNCYRSQRVDVEQSPNS